MLGLCSFHLEVRTGEELQLMMSLSSGQTFYIQGTRFGAIHVRPFFQIGFTGFLDSEQIVSQL